MMTSFYTSQGEAVGSIFVNLLVSSQHVEVNLSELKGYEKHVIVELIKENHVFSDTNPNCTEDNCKGIGILSLINGYFNDIDEWCIM